jgi:hypothetical protein
MAPNIQTLVKQLVLLNLFQHPICKVDEQSGYLSCGVLKQVQNDVYIGLIFTTKAPFGAFSLFQYFYLLKVFTKLKLVGFVGVYRYFFDLLAIGDDF